MKEMREHAENKTGEYEVTSHDPSNLSDQEIGACAAIIRRGEAVNPRSADKELGRSEVIAIVRKGTDIIRSGCDQAGSHRICFDDCRFEEEWVYF